MGVVMTGEHDNRLEQSIRFVARRYREGGLDADRAWQRFASAHAIRREGAFRRYWIGAAAAVLALVGMAAWFTLERNAPDWVAIATSPGQTKDVYLPDSSLVALAGDSWVRYDARRYGKERRAVEMKGKAFFQVTRDEVRPFSVKTGRTEVTVLGTSFQVDERPAATEVHVVAGKVRFAAGKEKEPVILTAGMSARYAMENGEITVATEADANKLAWRTGRLRFVETPLEKVIEDLSDYYQVRIENRARNEGARLTATFTDLSLEDALRVVNQTLDARLVATSKK